MRKKHPVSSQLGMLWVPGKVFTASSFSQGSNNEGIFTALFGTGTEDCKGLLAVRNKKMRDNNKANDLCETEVSVGSLKCVNAAEHLCYILILPINPHFYRHIRHFQQICRIRYRALLMEETCLHHSSLLILPHTSTVRQNAYKSEGFKDIFSDLTHHCKNIIKKRYK